MPKQLKGPQFVRFISPIINILQEIGGAGKPTEITDLVLERVGISEKEQLLTNSKSGGSKVRNQVAWARFYLTRAGLLESSRYGIWALTEKGLTAKLTPEEALCLFKGVQKQFQKEKAAQSLPNVTSELSGETAIDEEADVFQDHRSALMALLQGMPPAGFERLCQRLLRESGFEQVLVTGRSGDGGIDGQGILALNAFVSFKVLFQCKRYIGSVSVSQVRDFRGAMVGRADKGIIITTGTFTSDATKEARRDGAPPIELVNGDSLISMFEKHELGLKPKTSYDLDYDFFASFQHKDA